MTTSVLNWSLTMLRTHINAIFYLPLLIPLTTNLFNKQPIWCSRLYRSNSDNNCTRLWRCTASIIENIKATLSILINYGEVHDVSCSFLIKYCFSAWYMDDYIYVSSMAPSVYFFACLFLLGSVMLIFDHNLQKHFSLVESINRMTVFWITS